MQSGFKIQSRAVLSEKGNITQASNYFEDFEVHSNCIVITCKFYKEHYLWRCLASFGHSELTAITERGREGGGTHAEPNERWLI